jgi:hypothetical protein
LAVKKSSPFARPGTDVDLRMLWFDGRSEPGPGEDDVEVVWFCGCINPPGDLFYLCYLQLAYAGLLLELPGFSAGDSVTYAPTPQPEQPGRAAEPIDLVRTGSGPSFVYPVPSTLIESHPPPDDPGQPPYGVAYVFFTACAGQLGLKEEWRDLAERIAELSVPEEGREDSSAGDESDFGDELTRLVGGGGVPNTFPLACYGDSQDLLGPDQFVAGYTTLYAYADVENDNPIVLGLQVAETEFELPDESEPVCVGDQCAGGESPDDELLASQDCSDHAACIPTCDKDDRDDCPSYEIALLLDPSHVETNELSGSTEPMWVRYYTSAGSLDGDIKLVNDPATGFNAEISCELRAPQDAGPFFVWGVVHDARGGVNWARASVLATE